MNQGALPAIVQAAIATPSSRPSIRSSAATDGVGRALIHMILRRRALEVGCAGLLVAGGGAAADRRGAAAQFDLRLWATGTSRSSVDRSSLTTMRSTTYWPCGKRHPNWRCVPRVAWTG
jgi:hypothetical protein